MKVELTKAESAMLSGAALNSLPWLLLSYERDAVTVFLRKLGVLLAEAAEQEQEPQEEQEESTEDKETDAAGFHRLVQLARGTGCYHGPDSPDEMVAFYEGIFDELHRVEGKAVEYKHELQKVKTLLEAKVPELRPRKGGEDMDAIKRALSKAGVQPELLTSQSPSPRR